MSSSSDLAQHLPHLRRFARALSGSQKSGDAYVAATLETLIADPATLAGQSDKQLALYGAFLALWNSVPINTANTSAEVADTRLGELPSMERQAFLLTAMEGFSPDRAALALGLERTSFDVLSERAAREVANQVATDVLIIEDEPIISMDLESIVTGLGHRAIDIAATHREAVAIAAAAKPGLILADIQLADGSSGLDAVNEILAGFDVPVIFITAFPERFLTGERPEPAYLLTKPFHTNALIGIISQALFFNEVAKLKGASGTASIRSR